MTESVRESRLHEWLRDNAPDCGDNSCLFGGRGKGGVRTNGGCRCFKDLPTAKRIYVERLYEAFTQSESGLRPEDQFSMGDPHPCDMTAEERERAFTPSHELLCADLKQRIGDILVSALQGTEKKYRNDDGYVRWGLVQKDINAAVDALAHDISREG